MENVAKAFENMIFKNKVAIKNRNYFVLKLISFFVVFFIFNSVKIFNNVSACNFGIFTSLFFLTSSPLLVSFAYVCASALNWTTSWEIVFYVAVLFVCFVAKLLLTLKKKTVKTYYILIVALLLGIVNLLMNIVISGDQPFLQ